MRLVRRRNRKIAHTDHSARHIRATVTFAWPLHAITCFGTFIKNSGDFGTFRKGLIAASAHRPHTDLGTTCPGPGSASKESRMTRFFMVRHHEAAESRLACAEVVSAKCRVGFAETIWRERPRKGVPVKLRHSSSGVIPRAAAVAGLLYLLAPSAFAQQDPGVRGGLQNTAGYLEYRGIPIPHPPVISPNPTTGATITSNELGVLQRRHQPRWPVGVDVRHLLGCNARFASRGVGRA